jgi:uncharacterized protein
MRRPGDIGVQPVFPSVAPGSGEPRGLQNGALLVAFRLEEHVGMLPGLLQKYRDIPMSLADACIVRMAEIHEDHRVLTLDSDFIIYRRRGRLPLTLMHPSAMPD